MYFFWAKSGGSNEPTGLALALPMICNSKHDFCIIILLPFRKYKKGQLHKNFL